ncbi:helix-turn-helix domain-containing protein [Streptomyces lavendulae]|uniref:helix-turn-helix domain-containing protein n=1 Tax=Streptomyces lavendulae TaxID=1914 RepID=UPI0036AA3240
MTVSDEQGPAGRLLGDELRHHRVRLGYTLADAAAVIRGSTSKISRLERGESPPKPRDIWDLAKFYKLTREQQAQLEQLLAQTGNAEAFARFADVTPHFLKRLIRLEGTAEWITVFEPRVVPGLLQVEAYARALVCLMEVDLPDSDVDRTVELRMRRQMMLQDGGTPRLVAIIAEEVLYRAYGPPAVMVEQMKHLLRATGTRQSNVRIVPKGAMTPPYPIFTLSFPDGMHQEIAYVENLDGATYVTQKRQLDKYRRLMLNVRAAAHGRAESTAVLREALAHWQGLAAADRRK